MNNVNRNEQPGQPAAKAPASPAVTVNRVIDPKYQVPTLDQIKGFLTDVKKTKGS